MTPDFYAIIGATGGLLVGGLAGYGRLMWWMATVNQKLATITEQLASHQRILERIGHT
ncbi:MAG: hypothetical protein ACYCXG_11775 [Acidiferrobacter sp.]